MEEVSSTLENMYCVAIHKVFLWREQAGIKKDRKRMKRFFAF